MSAPPSSSKPTISSTRSRRLSKSAPNSLSRPTDRSAQVACCKSIFPGASPSDALSFSCCFPYHLQPMENPRVTFRPPHRLYSLTFPGGPRDRRHAAKGTSPQPRPPRLAGHPLSRLQIHSSHPPPRPRLRHLLYSDRRSRHRLLLHHLQRRQHSSHPSPAIPRPCQPRLDFQPW